MVYNWIKSARSWWFPPVCLLCGDRAGPELDLCDPCRLSLPDLATACEACGDPLPAPGLCGRCQARGRGPVDRMRCVFAYQPPVDQWIQRLKYQGSLVHGRLLGELMALSLRHQAVSVPELLLPVPLHPSKLARRGFNQALELSRVLARRFNVPVDVSHGRRRRRTEDQSLLPADRRAANVAQAFEVAPIPGIRHVAIVDDVVTTGSTVEALATALRGAGIATVDVWACARALRSGHSPRV